MIRYVFSDEPLTIKNAKDADAQALGEALAAVSDKAGGHVTPGAVVEAARDKNSALHRHFTWDVKKAAEERWLDQARAIIRIVRVEDEEAEGGTSRAYYSIADKTGTTYRPLDVVRKSVDLQAALLKAAEADLQAFERRYRSIKDICELVADVRTCVAARRVKHESHAAL